MDGCFEYCKRVPETLTKNLSKMHDLFSSIQVNSLIQDCEVSVMVELGLFYGNKERQDEKTNLTVELLEVHFRDVLSYHVTTTSQNHLLPFHLVFYKSLWFKISITTSQHYCITRKCFSKR